jgi:multiple sugar transport system substrate-binding protein
MPKSHIWWLTRCYLPDPRPHSHFFRSLLEAYDASPVWIEDPKHTPYRDAMRNSLYPETAVDDFIVVDMVASVCAGSATPEAAVAEAERRAKSYYK